MKKEYLLFLVLFLVGCIVLISCKPPDASQHEVSKEQSIVPSVTPVQIKALVTFVSGSVDALRKGVWGPLQIGENVDQETVVKVRERSYCEIQFGNTAVVRINENTQIVLEKLVIQEGENQVDVKMDSGAVLAKVSKLSGKDKFQVRTGVAVCGVRGTEFGVTAAPDGKMHLKVKEGKVVVLPTTADVETIGKKITKDEKTAKVVETVVTKVYDAAPVVQKNEEIVITPEVVQKTQNLIKKAEQEIPQIVAKSTEPTIEKDIASLVEEVTKTVSAVIEKPSILKEENKKVLAVLDTMEIIPVPVTPPPSAASQTSQEKPKEEKRIPLVVVTITATPEDSEILLEGNLIGRGSLKRIMEEGSKLTFRIQKEGYEPQDLSVEAKGKLDYKVELKPKPREVSILVEPTDAEILVDGTLVGKGTYKALFEVGKEIKIGVRKPGYEEKTTTLKINLDTAPTLKLALGKVSKEIQISTIPKEARIFLGNTPVGSGSYRAFYYVGDTLHIKVQHPGYKERQLTMQVKETGDNFLEVSLERLRKTLSVTTDPSDAEITLNGRPVGKGRYSETFDYGMTLAFDVSREGYVRRTIGFEVGDSTQETYSIQLERQMKELSISVDPRDASIVLDGRVLGQGNYQGRFGVGEKLTFHIRRDGYNEKTLSIIVTPAVSSTYQVELEARPIYTRIKAGPARIVGLASTDQGKVLGTDMQGRVFCVSLDGRVLWSLQTANAPNETTPPVLHEGKVYFSGSKELVIFDMDKGTVLSRKPHDSASANLFGRRPVPSAIGLLFPTSQNILILDSQTGETRKSIPIGGDSVSTPLFYKGKLFVPDQLGKVHVLDGASGAEEAVIETQALQPVALAIQAIGNVGYFSGRRGAIAAIDLEARKVLWQSKIEDPQAQVFHDLSCSDAGIFVFSRNNLYCFDPKVGRSLFSPITEVSSPPILRGDLLYFGTLKGAFIQRDLKSGITRTVDIQGKASSRPIGIGNEYLAVGTESGEVVVLNPKGFK